MSTASYGIIPAGVAPPAGHCCPMLATAIAVPADHRSSARRKKKCSRKVRLHDLVSRLCQSIAVVAAPRLLLHRGCCGCCCLPWSWQQRDSTHGLASLSGVTIARKRNRCEAAKNRSAKTRWGQITTEHRAELQLSLGRTASPTRLTDPVGPLTDPQFIGPSFGTGRFVGADLGPAATTTI